MIRKSGYRFSEKIKRKQKIEPDDDSKRSHAALARAFSGESPNRHVERVFGADFQRPGK